ncbi:MAG: hypothetical protein RLZZ162_3221, partial [Verrucomicrobiota bacterium]
MPVRGGGGENENDYEERERCV